MKRIIILGLIFSMVGCGAVDSMTEGFKHSREVAADLEKAAGARPFVGFNWSNGVLTNVSITFDGAPVNKSVNELMELSRNSVAAHFKQKPKKIIIAFSFTGTAHKPSNVKRKDPNS